MKINNRVIENYYRETDTRTEITNDSLMELLVDIGDFSPAEGSALRSQLQTPGITREQQFEILSSQIEKWAKKDLFGIAFSSKIKMSPGVDNFVDALLGRDKLSTDFGDVVISNNISNRLKGYARENTYVEMINLTTASQEQLHLTDASVVGITRNNGSWSSIPKDIQEGDYLRFRTIRDGQVSDWLTTQAGAGTSDARNAQLNLSYLEIVAYPGQKPRLNLKTRRPITEPHANIQVTNQRTGEKILLQANEDGCLSYGSLDIKAKPGDLLSLAISDGTHNLDFSETLGSMEVRKQASREQFDVFDPSPMKRDLEKLVSKSLKKKRIEGSLFHYGISDTDPVQGSAGTCAVVSAASAFAHLQPELLKELFEDHGDGTFSIKFHTSPREGGYTKKVVVDNEFYVRGMKPHYSGKLRFKKHYGGFSYDAPPPEMELWFPLLEKAFAKLRGGYEEVGQGNVVRDVFFALTGKSSKVIEINDADKNSIFNSIKESLAKKQPIVAGTKEKEELISEGDDGFENHHVINKETGVVYNHAYSVKAARVNPETGKKELLLRNPWGYREMGNDGKNDGIFWVNLDTFTKNFRHVTVANI